MSTSKKEFRTVIDLFRNYYIVITKNENFRVSMSDSRAKVVEGFIVDFKKLYSTNILQDKILKSYFDFQFNYWYRKDAKYGKGTSIQIEWIIGNKAVERWKNDSKRYLSFKVRKNLKKDNDFTKIRKKVDVKRLSVFIEVQEREERLKAKNLNMENCLEICTLNTTLYNHKSSNCMSCKFKKECKKNLKSMYPAIYKLRGYDN